MLISNEKRLLLAELKGCVAFITYFCIFFRSGMTISSFILLRYVQQILGRVEGLLGSKSSEKAHLIRVLLPVTYKKLFGKVLPNWLFLVPMLKGCFHYFFASWFCKSKGEHLWNKERCFLFHCESSFRSWDNQIFNLWDIQISRRHQVSKHKTRNPFYWTWKVNAAWWRNLASLRNNTTDIFI